MILWLIIALFIILVIIYYSTKNNTISPILDISSVDVPDIPSLDVPIPTIHARCREESVCGDNLTCDLTCHRCKRPENGECATDVDCSNGLICHNWVCIPSSQVNISPNFPPHNKSSNKHVRWNDSNNQIFTI